MRVLDLVKASPLASENGAKDAPAFTMDDDPDIRRRLLVIMYRRKSKHLDRRIYAGLSSPSPATSSSSESSLSKFYQMSELGERR